MKIFLAEDDHGIIDVMTIILKQQGNEIAVLKNPDTAVGEIMAFSPDLILLDISLFGKDGRTLAKQLKAKKELDKIPLIVLSANAEIADVAKQVGADDFLAKPFSLDELVNKITPYIH